MSEDSSERPAFKSVDAYYAIARTLQVRKEYQRALFYLALALRQDDRHIPSYLLRSLCYMILCETDKALADVKTVLQYEPKNPHALLLLAEIYYLRGDFEEALRTFHQGVKLRPTIDRFMIGVHKCEAAIQNSCNDCRITLSPDMDLTEFYLRAFPPRRQAKTNKRIYNKASKSESTDEAGSWPTERPRDVQLQLMKQSFSDFNYLNNLFTAETRRAKQFRRNRSEGFIQMSTAVDQSSANRQSALNCATYLDRHAELFHKLDPGLRNTKNTL